jgi:hypothetical protein
MKNSVACVRDRIELVTLRIKVKTDVLTPYTLSRCSIKVERFLTSSFTPRHTRNSPAGAMAFSEGNVKVFLCVIN